MSKMTIKDLPESKTLDSKALASVRGGIGTGTLAPLANVGIDIDIDQQNFQYQNTEISILNNSIVGPGVGLHLPVYATPYQYATNYASVGEVA
jgi:hypothetical protein